MVLAREQVTEQLERFGFGTLRQFIRPPGLANQASGTGAVAFGEQDPREREAALGACRLIAYEATNGGGVAAFLPQMRLRPLAHESHARPARAIGDERRVSAEVRLSVRMAQDEPFNKFPRRRVADRFLYPRRLALSNRDMLCMPSFRERGVAVVPHPGRFLRLLGLLRLAAAPCNSISRTYREHRQDQET